MMLVHRCESPDQLRVFLNTDAFETAYALGDLEPTLWEDAVFWGISQSDDLRGILLLYHAFNPPALCLHGEVGAVEKLLASVELPPEVFCLAPLRFKEAFGEYYDASHVYPLLRMSLTPETYIPDAVPPLDKLLRLVRLRADDVDRLNILYAQAAEPGETISAFLPSQIEQGVFWGIAQDDDLLAAAGTHVVSPAENIAAVGNVFTLPTMRGQGLGKLTTAAVLKQLFEDGITRVVLNVKASNSPARRVYEGLGFRVHSEFIEGPARMK
jgi:ribosomal protein S18 acetylase RimI-like enzyme